MEGEAEEEAPGRGVELGEDTMGGKRIIPERLAVFDRVEEDEGRRLGDEVGERDKLLETEFDGLRGGLGLLEGTPLWDIDRLLDRVWDALALLREGVAVAVVVIKILEEGVRLRVGEAVLGGVSVTLGVVDRLLEGLPVPVGLELALGLALGLTDAVDVLVCVDDDVTEPLPVEVGLGVAEELLVGLGEEDPDKEEERDWEGEGVLER